MEKPTTRLNCRQLVPSPSGSPSAGSELPSPFQLFLLLPYFSQASLGFSLDPMKPQALRDPLP